MPEREKQPSKEQLIRRIFERLVRGASSSGEAGNPRPETPKRKEKKIPDEQKTKAVGRLLGKFDERAQNTPKSGSTENHKNFKEMPPKERFAMLKKEIEAEETKLKDPAAKNKHERQKRIIEELEFADPKKPPEKKAEEVRDLLTKHWDNFDEEFDPETSAIDSLVLEELWDYTQDPNKPPGEPAKILTPEGKELTFGDVDMFDGWNENNDLGDLDNNDDGRIKDILSSNRKLNKEELSFVDDQIESYLDSIELSELEVRSIEMDDNMRHIRQYMLRVERTNPEEALKIRRHVNTIVASHNIYINIERAPLDRNKQGSITENLKWLTTDGILDEFTRDYGGLNGAIGKMNRQIEVAVPLIIAKSPGHKFLFENLGKDSQPDGDLWKNLQESLEGKLTEEDADKRNRIRDRIARRSIKMAAVTGRIEYAIAAHAEVPIEATESSGKIQIGERAKYKQIPFEEISKIYRTSDYSILRWGLVDGHEDHVIFAEAWGNGDHHEGKTRVDLIMNDFSDSFSSGFMIDDVVPTLDRTGYQDFGLWMRYQGASGEAKAGVLNRLIAKDTHILPLAAIYQHDDNFHHLLEHNGHHDFHDFYAKVAPALHEKLQVQLANVENQKLGKPLETLSEHAKAVLSENHHVIEEIQQFLEKRKDELLEGRVTIREHGKTYQRTLSMTQQKTLSLADLPFEMLMESKAIRSEPGFFARKLTNDWWNEIAIQQAAIKAVTHPENFAAIDELTPLLEVQGGRDGINNFTKYGIPAIKKLYEPYFTDTILPNAVYELFPSLSANLVSEIRGFTPSMGPGEWMRKLEYWANTGLIPHTLVEEARKKVHATLLGRMPRIILYITLVTIATAVAAGVAKGMGDLNGGGDAQPHH